MRLTAVFLLFYFFNNIVNNVKQRLTVKSWWLVDGYSSGDGRGVPLFYFFPVTTLHLFFSASKVTTRMSTYLRYM